MNKNNHVNLTDKHHTLIFIVLFVFSNLIAGNAVFASFFNRHITPFELTLIGVINSFLADIVLLSFIAFLGVIIFKKRLGLFIYLLVLTIFFNVAFVQLYMYSSFFGTSQTIRLTMQTLANPVDGLAEAVVLSTLRTVFFELRILFFLPTFILVTHLIYVGKTDTLKKKDQFLASFSLRRIITISFSSIILIASSWILTQQMTLNSETSIFNRPLFAIRQGGIFNFYTQEVFSVTGLIDMNLLGNDEFLDSQEHLVDVFNTNQIKYNNQLNLQSYSKHDNHTGLFRENGLQSGVNEDFNLFVIQLESWNNFLINLEVNGIKVAPFLSKLASDNFYFDNVLQSVGRGNTNDAELSALTGLYGRHDERILQTFESEMTNGLESLAVATLPHLFNQIDYRTMYFHGSPGSFYRRRDSFSKLLGFQNTFFKEEFLEKMQVPSIDFLPANYTYKSWITDKVVLDWALEEAYETVSHLEQNFFAYITLLQPHAPFMLGEQKKNNNWGKNVTNPQIQAYLDGINYLDSILEDFMTRAQQELPNTLFLLFGDHGIAGTIRGNSLRYLLGVDNTFDETHGLLNVPLIFVDNANVLQDNIQPKTFSNNASLVRAQRDVFRTILNFFELWEEVDNLGKKYSFGTEVFGVNIFSDEPSIAIAIRTSHIQTDAFFTSLINVGKRKMFEEITLDEIARQIQVVKDLRNLNLHVLRTRRILRL